MGIKVTTKIQCFHTGTDPYTANVWFDSGRSIEVSNVPLDCIDWLQNNAFGANGAVISATIMDAEGVMVGFDQKVFSLVKDNAGKNLGVISENYDFGKDTEYFLSDITPDTKLIYLAEFYSEPALMLMIDFAIASGDKELFMSLTADLNKLKGGE